MAQFRAGNLDNRNVGSRIAAQQDGDTIYGIIASIRRSSDEVTVMLSDNETSLDLKPGDVVDIHLSGPELAAIESAKAMDRIEETFIRLAHKVQWDIDEREEYRSAQQAERVLRELDLGVMGK
jgi:hypothetical protein